MSDELAHDRRPIVTLEVHAAIGCEHLEAGQMRQWLIMVPPAAAVTANAGPVAVHQMRAQWRLNE